MIILLTAFGSTVESARQDYANIELKVRQAFPDCEVCWAYTSAKVRRNLAAQRAAGQTSAASVFSPQEVLAGLGAAGIKEIVVQSLHVMPGQEYQDLLQIARQMQGLPKSLERIAVGSPLLSSPADAAFLARAFFEQHQGLLGTTDVSRAVVYVGHGSPLPLPALVYPAMQYYLHRQHPRLFMTTVEGEPDFAQLVAELRQKKILKAHLVPFMTVAGEHILNDVAGEENSLRALLASAGIECTVSMQGLGSTDRAVELWLKHLAAAIRELQKGL